MLDAEGVIVGDEIIHLLLLKKPELIFHLVVLIVKSFKLEPHLGIVPRAEPDLFHALLTASCLY